MLAENASLKEQIERLKGTQSAADRTLTRVKTEKDNVAGELETATAARDALQAEFDQAYRELEELRPKVTEYETLQAQNEALTLELNKMRVVAEMSASSPGIALLAKTKALPQAEDIDAFKAALEEIASGLNEHIDTASKVLLQGAHVSLAPGVNTTKTADELEKEGYDLIARQQSKKGIEMIEQARELRSKQ